MSGTTNRISFEEAADLLGSGRACVAYVVDGAPRVETAVVRHADQRFVLGVDAGSELGRDVDEVSFVIDAGVLFFDLRAISARGSPSPVDDPPGAESGLLWFEVDPTVVTCWDYGRLRVDDGHH